MILARASSVQLVPFEPARHLPLLRIWLRRPHVARWWGDANDAIAAVSQHSPLTEALIAVDAKPVGYLCWQNLQPAELAAAGLSELPTDLIDVDILIGEPDVMGRGVGPHALSLLLERLRADGVAWVGLGTAADNQRALRAFEKVGFQRVRAFHEAGREMCYFVRKLRAAI